MALKTLLARCASSRTTATAMVAAAPVRAPWGVFSPPAAAVRAFAAKAGGAAAVVSGAAPRVVPAVPVAAEAVGEYEYKYYDEYGMIASLPPYASVAPRVPPVVLPPKKPSAPDLNLVLDLDYTLVYPETRKLPGAEFSFHVPDRHGGGSVMYALKRPHLDHFLEWASTRFEVTVFTASDRAYAERMMDLLDPEKKYIHHRVYRDSILNLGFNYVKDLTVLGRDLAKTMLVDDSPLNFGYQPDNGIPITTWMGRPGRAADTELLKLIKFLETLLGQPDVRPLLRDKFQVHKYVAAAVR